MVSHGEGLLGSQFIITLSGDLTSLDGEHVVFGQIVEGDELLLKLNEAITDDQHRPYQDIRLVNKYGRNLTLKFPQQIFNKKYFLG